MDSGARQDQEVRRELERIWDLKLRHARQRYVRAAAEFHRNVVENGVSPFPSGAGRAEAEAFAEYCRVLATFTELVGAGKLPDADAANGADGPCGAD